MLLYGNHFNYRHPLYTGAISLWVIIVHNGATMTCTTALGILKQENTQNLHWRISS